MDEVWQRAVEAAIEGEADDSSSSLKTLTLDGAAKCLHGRLPPPELLERFQSLEHLSIANTGVSSLEAFPRLRNLRRLILSDNRIAGGLEFLVQAGLDSLRDLDLSNNRIQFLEDLAPLSNLRLISLDLYECPVTRIVGYRSSVFAMIQSLKYLDKMDADENERPETDEEEEEEDDDDDDDDEEEEDDPGSGEVDGDYKSEKLENGTASRTRDDGIVDVDEDDESDADEEETETVRVEGNGLSNGLLVAHEDEEEDDEVEDDGDGDEDLGEEIDEEEGEDEDVVQVQDIGESDDEEFVDEEDDDEVDVDEDEEDVDDEEDVEPARALRVVSADGEIDGHEQGEEDENGEIGEEEQVVDDDRDLDNDDGEGEDEEEDARGKYVVHHIDQGEAEAGQRDLNVCNGEDEDGVDDDDDEDDDSDNDDGVNGFYLHNNGQSSSSTQPSKRRRVNGKGPSDGIVGDSRSSKHL